MHPRGLPTRGGGSASGRVCLQGFGGLGGWADPPKLEKQAVRILILLECFLVKHKILHCRVKIIVAQCFDFDLDLDFDLEIDIAFSVYTNMRDSSSCDV